MSENAMFLLRKMANEFDKTKRKSYDSDFYIAFPDRIINELESYGCFPSLTNLNFGPFMHSYSFYCL